ncbi:hypothetical protein P280DRAFT_546838 [Massarina eburnea CBS 473.64]|uniref:DUF4604 domain-containing protein n=1 Tax=Massarina eburnea CBS 473.64 TaxID=1395130 RepID=A0A6A6SB50_9PLEO|nr:hypothetical protein P280DRAFT_546838 [Massarina eburnea CBS 473.64]
MSFKTKDLQYDNPQPAFLQRLRGQLAGDGSGRHERPDHRNKKTKEDDEEDAPAYVVEETNDSLTKAEYEAMLAGKDAEDDAAATEGGGQAKDAATKKDNIAEVGKVTKKRKVAKVIGGENDEKNTAKKAKKKGKPVKLSFGDEEG